MHLRPFRRPAKLHSVYVPNVRFRFPSGHDNVLPAEQKQVKRFPFEIPENETKMNFYSPFDDFVLNSLAAIAGLFHKLEYVANLRQEDGSYRHWGLARVHGEDEADQAAMEAHRLLFSKVLNTPLATLLDDAESQFATGRETEEYFDYLSQRLPRLAPEGTGKGPVLHFNSVLHAVSALERARSRASRPAS